MPFPQSPRSEPQDCDALIYILLRNVFLKLSPFCPWASHSLQLTSKYKHTIYLHGSLWGCIRLHKSQWTDFIHPYVIVPSRSKGSRQKKKQQKKASHSLQLGQKKPTSTVYFHPRSQKITNSWSSSWALGEVEEVRSFHNLIQFNHLQIRIPFVNKKNVAKTV